MAGAYSRQERDAAVRRVHEGETMAGVARDIGASPSTVRRWIRASRGKETGHKTGHHKRPAAAELPDWAEDFLVAFAATCNVSRACNLAEIARSTAYEARESIPAFAEAWERARAIGADALEDEAVRRALEGVEVPIVKKGEVVATVHKYSDTLLIFLLKGAKPEKYRERHELTGRDGGPVETRIVFVYDDEDPGEVGDDAG